MHALTLQVDGRAFGGQAAALDADFVRWGEIRLMFSGTAALHHTHVASDIGDLSATVLQILSDHGITGSPDILLRPNGGLASGVDGLYVDSGIVSFRGHKHVASDISDFSASVLALLGPDVDIALRPNGGLASGVDGLYVDSGIVSFRGHKHVASDILDFSGAVAVQLGNDIFDSSTIFWNRMSSGVQAFVRLNPVGGLTYDDNGVAANFGSGVNQIPRGNHSHSQLHNPVTLQPSSSLKITLNGQDVGLEVLLAPLSGLKITPSGLAADFGAGHNQVMRGDATTTSGGSLTVFSSPSLALSYDPVANVLSGSVRLDSNPSFGRGEIGVSAGGLYVVLGTDAQSAAAGNHIHATATSGTDGFMSAVDKRHLDTLWASGGLTVDGGNIDGPIYMHDSIFFDSGLGIFVQNKKVVGNQQPAPGALTINVGGVINDILAAIPDPLTITFGDASGVQKLIGDLTTNILPKIRNALASIANKDNQIITAGKNFGYIG